MVGVKFQIAIGMSVCGRKWRNVVVSADEWSGLAPRDSEGEMEPERTEIIGLCGQ